MDCIICNDVIPSWITARKKVHIIHFSLVQCSDDDEDDDDDDNDDIDDDDDNDDDNNNNDDDDDDNAHLQRCHCSWVRSI